MSSTRINNPSARSHVSGRTTGTIQGAVQGSAFGPAGTVIGAVVGFIGGSQADKSAKHAMLAYKYAKMRSERQAAIVRRNVINNFRMARAAAMTMIGNEEGGTKSSATQGAVSSTGAQFGFNLNFFDADTYLQSMYQKHANKAGKKAASANMINSTLASVASTLSAYQQGWKVPSPPSPSTGPTITPQVMADPYGPAWANDAS